MGNDSMTINYIGLRLDVDFYHDGKNLHIEDVTFNGASICEFLQCVYEKQTSPGGHPMTFVCIEVLQELAEAEFDKSWTHEHEPCYEE